MNKKIIVVFLFTAVLSAALCAQERLRTRGKEGGMMLDLSKFTVGTMNKVEDKKQYLSTIQLEKQRIQNYTLGVVYENAFLFYRRGDYQRAYDLAQSVVNVDPEFKNARTLAEQARRMGTYGTISESEIIDAKMTDAESLYAKGRLIEAQRKYEEILAIQPHNAKARAQVSKIEKEIADEYDRRGDDAYADKDYEKALDRWYNALMIRKDDGPLVAKITKAEKQVKDDQLQAAMKQGAEYYTNGKLVPAYDSFQTALKIQPGEPRAAKYSAQLRDEIGKGYVNAGNKAFSSGKYDNAVANWNEAKKWGYDAGVMDNAIKKARAAKDKAAQISKPSTATQQPEEFDATFTPPSEEFKSTLPTVESGRVSEENRRLSSEAYIRGTKAFNDEDYETARKEWTVARQLDPGNTEAEQGLRRVQEMLEWR